jgi:hypothetical protein
MDVARGTAIQIDGRDTITYEIEAVAGPLGENASGLITRAFVGPGGDALVVADVTCLAVAGHRAALIGRVRPLESVNTTFEALLLQIYDGTPELQPDAVSSGIDPTFGGEITFTQCAAFLPPAPFPTPPITAGDFQVIDGSAVPPPPPPPPPPPECEEDEDGDSDCQGEDEQGDG